LSRGEVVLGDRSGKTPTSVALDLNDVESLVALQEGGGADADAVQKAVGRGNIPAILALLRAGVPCCGPPAVNAHRLGFFGLVRGPAGWPISLSAWEGFPLVEAAEDAEMASLLGWSPLLTAMVRGGRLPRGDSRRQDIGGWDALAWASACGREEAVRLLAPSAWSTSRELALLIAVSHDNTAIVEILLGNWRRDTSGWDSLLLTKAIESSNDSMILALLNAGVRAGGVGQSLLERAVRAKRWRVARALLAAGAEPGESGSSGGPGQGDRFLLAASLWRSEAQVE
jgi:hypothetical protein